MRVASQTTRLQDPRDLLYSNGTRFVLYRHTASDVPGATSVVYDVLLSTNAVGWGYDTTSCIESNESDLVATETSNPLPGNRDYYLVRAENTCGASMGTDSHGAASVGRLCP